nr:DUF4270 family protein [Bacteroidota bacterium]
HFDSVTSYPQTRFKLSEEFGNKILNATEDELSSNPKFVELIKGINITADPVLSGGAIVSYNLISALSSAQIYYSNSKNDSLIYTFVINSACPRFMNFSHYNYVNASQSFRDQVVSGDTNLGSNRLYAQAMAGVKTKISFPHLKNLVQGNSIAINEAKLIISNATPNSVNAPPTEMSLIRIREDGGLDFLVDQFEGAEYFGGYYDYANNEYFFRITRHVQSIISKDTVDYGLYLVVTGASIIPNRLVIDGYNPTSSAEENRLKLDLIYTVLKN